jgi:hypothetical protein
MEARQGVYLTPDQSKTDVFLCGLPVLFTDRVPMMVDASEAIVLMDLNEYVRMINVPAVPLDKHHEGSQDDMN